MIAGGSRSTHRDSAGLLDPEPRGRYRCRRSARSLDARGQRSSTHENTSPALLGLLFQGHNVPETHTTLRSGTL